MGLSVLSCSHLFPPREGAKAASPRESEEHVTLGGHLHPPHPTLCPLDYVSQPSSAMQFPFHSTRDQATFEAQDGGGGLSPSGCPAAVAEAVLLRPAQRGNKEPHALLSGE